MKPCFKLPARRAWLISAIPLLINISSCLFAKISSHLSSQQPNDNTLQDLDSVALLDRIVASSIQVYGSYIYFVAVMLLLDFGSALINAGSRGLYPKLEQALRVIRNLLRKESLKTDSLSFTVSSPILSAIQPSETKLEPLETRLKSTGVLIFEAILTYSIIYLSYVLILSIFPCMIHSLFVIFHKDTYLSLDRSSNRFEGLVVLEHTSQRSNLLPILEDNNKKNTRMLSELDKNDIVIVLSSLAIENPDYIATSGDQEMLVFKNGNGSRIDLSDPSSPNILTPTINLNFTGLLSPAIKLASPDTQTIIVESDSTIYVFNISEPGTQRQLKLPSNYNYSQWSKHYAFSSDSKKGYFADTGLYQFDTSSLEVAKIQAFDPDRTDCVAISNSNDVMFMSLTDDQGEAYILFINVTDNEPSNDVIIHRINLTDYVSSVAFSPDDETLYISMGESDPLLIYNISVMTSPKLLYKSHNENLYPYEDILLSSDGGILVINDPEKHSMMSLRVMDVSDPTNPVIFNSKLIYSVSTVKFLPNSRVAFLSTKFGCKIVTFAADMQLKNQISYTALNLETSIFLPNLTEKVMSFALAANRTTAVAIGFGFLNILTASNETVFIPQKEFKIPVGNWHLLFVDHNLAFVAYPNHKHDYLPGQVDIINLSNGETLSSIDYFLKMDEASFKFAVLPDCKTALSWWNDGTYDENICSLYTTDITNLTSPGDFELLLPGFNENCDDFTFMADQEMLIIARPQNLSIYNISDLKNPTLLGTTSVYLDSEVITRVAQIALTSDNATLLARVTTNKAMGILVLLDISNLPQIQYLSSTDMGMNMYDSVLFYYKIYISPDNGVAFVPENNNVIIVDISNKTSPILSGFVHSSNNSDYTSITFLSESSTFPIAITDDYGNAIVVEFDPPYAVQMSAQTVARGEAIPNRLMLVARNTAGGYNMMTQDYQFIAASLYSLDLTEINPRITQTSLPNWISFDIKNKVLNMKPTSDQDIGPYSIYLSVSTPVSAVDFSTYNQTDYKDLISTLLALGYIDSQLYLTPSFDSETQLLLPARFNSSEETAIRQSLAKHYFDMVVPVFVESSLDLVENSQQLSIATLTQFSLAVSISLLTTPNSTDSTQQCKFVEKFPSIVVPNFLDDYTVMSVQSPAFEVNSILQNVIINVPDNVSCGANITIVDNLNPNLYKIINDVTAYFHRNEPPIWNSTTSLQGIISKTTLSTDAFFFIALDEGMFSQSGLQYSFIIDDNHAKSWITQTGLSISGTPPEPLLPQFWSSKYHVTIKAANQYSALEIPFVLEVHMSLNYYWKLLVKVLSVIALWIYFYKFFNIVFKKYYRHPKDWVVRIGEEITFSDIYPIAFIKNALIESKTIMQEMQKSVARDLNCRSVSIKRLADFFYDTEKQEIDYEKLTQAIEKVIDVVLVAQESKSRHLISSLTSRKSLINQLILNEIALTRLNAKQEKKTKQVFEVLKDRWMYLVKKDPVTSWQFVVDTQNLYYELGVRYPHLGFKSQREDSQAFITNFPNSMSDTRDEVKVNGSISDRSINHVLLTGSSEKNVELIDRSKNHIKSTKTSQINIDLLGNALVAWAFKKHHINNDIMRVNIIPREQGSGYLLLPGVLNRFFKFDLDTLFLSKGNQIGYGITYTVVDDVLVFSGVPNRNLLGKTLVVQIVTKRDRILKELWLSEVGTCLEQKALPNKEILYEM